MPSNSNYNDVRSRLDATKGLKQAIDERKKLRKDNGDGLEEKTKKVVDQINQYKAIITGATSQGQALAKKYEKKVKNQFEELIALAMSNRGSGSDTADFLKKKVIKAFKKIQPEIKSLLVEEIFRAVGCPQEQSYSGGTLYIKLKSIDLFGLLKNAPETPEAQFLYEKDPVSYQPFPFSMNRAIYERIVDPLQPYSVASSGNLYLGSSGQPLFDMQYSPVNQFGETGDFLKIDLANRNTFVSGADLGQTNRVKEFLFDYFTTIKVVDVSSVFANLMNVLSGCISIQGGVSSSRVSADERLGIFIQRVLGLCFDGAQEIDVQGTAKIDEFNGVDDSFFTLSQIDERLIEEKINDIRNRVVEFEDCQNIKLPVDVGAILNGLQLIQNAQTPEEEDNQIFQVTNSLTQNPLWSFLIPSNINIQISVNLNFITQLPRAIIMAILSPKVLLPIMIILKSLGQQIADAFNDLNGFLSNFGTFFINLVSKIGSLFVRELFELIKKDILTLIRSIREELSKNAAAKQYAIIIALVELAIIIARIINDWRNCRSIIDELLELLKLAGSLVGNIPLPLLAFSQLSPGYSPDRAFANLVEDMQKSGLPTGPMPDGSPNLYMQSLYSQFKSHDKEESQNGKVEIAAMNQAVTPNGTVPMTMFGKKI